MSVTKERCGTCHYLIDYHINVHVFWNSLPPAVATFGLRKAAEKAESDVQDFMYKNFYVDDGLSNS